mmetsp:Transcript_33150/g.49088  ORF Transcript_33150/g.49088 Transcript_33150/m.49088 type:complete len:251 (-) Transcript_33150:190-942(-)
MRGNEDLMIIVMHVFAAIACALKSCNYFVFREFSFEVVQSELVFLDAFSLHNENIFFRIYVWHSKMVSNVKELVWRDVIFREQIDTWFAAPRFLSAWKIVGIADWVCLEHISELEVPSLLRILGREISDAMTFHPSQYMTAKVLPIHFPIRFKILSCSHQQARGATWMALQEKREVVDGSSEGVPQRFFVAMLRNFFETIGWKIGSRWRVIVIGLMRFSSVNRIWRRRRILLLRSRLDTFVFFQRSDRES